MVIIAKARQIRRAHDTWRVSEQPMTSRVLCGKIDFAYSIQVPAEIRSKMTQPIDTVDVTVIDAVLVTMKIRISTLEAKDSFNCFQSLYGTVALERFFETQRHHGMNMSNLYSSAQEDSRLLLYVSFFHGRWKRSYFVLTGKLLVRTP